MDDERPDAHLQDIDDGCGCAEVWEHTSEHRDGESTSADDDVAAGGADPDEGPADGTSDDTQRCPGLDREAASCPD